MQDSAIEDDIIDKIYSFLLHVYFILKHQQPNIHNIQSIIMSSREEGEHEPGTEVMEEETESTEQEKELEEEKTHEEEQTQARAREKEEEHHERNHNSSSHYANARFTAAEMDQLRNWKIKRHELVCPSVYKRHIKCQGGSCSFRHHYLPDVMTRGIPAHITPNQVKAAFQKYGQVTLTSLRPTLKQPEFKGEQDGFIHFTTHHDADEAILQLDSTCPFGGEFPIKVLYIYQ